MNDLSHNITIPNSGVTLKQGIKGPPGVFPGHQGTDPYGSDMRDDRRRVLQWLRKLTEEAELGELETWKKGYFGDSIDANHRKCWIQLNNHGSKKDDK